ncbi:conserved exported protein of unknown function [Methylocella tundrae]|uniref:Uncharacterized protein n=1 Tax=Methylocella tundrae TaxID=227605 RepID=A0A4U8Z642_METTU|nr:conserved exported protein of unknown function [Methylocella tundrae]
MKHSLSLYSFFGMLGLSFAAAGSAAAQSKSADGPTIKSNPAAQAQSLKQFKDWTIGCDNLRTCTALGLLPDQNAGAPMSRSAARAPATINRSSPSLSMPKTQRKRRS